MEDATSGRSAHPQQQRGRRLHQPPTFTRFRSAKDAAGQARLVGIAPVLCGRLRGSAAIIRSKDATRQAGLVGKASVSVAVRRCRWRGGEGPFHVRAAAAAAAAATTTTVTTAATVTTTTTVTTAASVTTTASRVLWGRRLECRLLETRLKLTIERSLFARPQPLLGGDLLNGGHDRLVIRSGFLHLRDVRRVLLILPLCITEPVQKVVVRCRRARASTIVPEDVCGIARAAARCTVESARLRPAAMMPKHLRRVARTPAGGAIEIAVLVLTWSKAVSATENATADR